MKKILIILLLFSLACMKKEEIKPEKEDVTRLYNRAMKLYAEQNYEEAGGLFRAVINETGEKEQKAKSYFYLGEINAIQGNNDRALISYSNAAGYGINTEQQIKRVAGKAETASLEKAIPRVSRNIRAYLLFTLGRKYQSAGRERKSEEVFERIVKNYPESVYARKAKYISEAKGRFKVGVLLPLSGPYSETGNIVKDGIEIGSRNLFVPVFTDTRGEPLKSYREAVDLIEKEEVSALIGPLLSLNAFSIACLSDYLEIPLVSPTATKGLIDSVGDDIHIINRTFREQTESLAKYAIMNLGLETFSILYPDSDYGKAMNKNFREEINIYGGKVLNSVKYKEGDTDFKDELRAIKKDNPDGIYIPAPSEDIPLIATQIKYFKIKSQILGADGWKDESIFNQIENSYLDGTIISDHPYRPTGNFRERFIYVYEREPERYAGLGYDAAKLTGEILNEPGGDISEYNLDFVAGSTGGANSSNKVTLYIISNGEYKAIRGR